MNKKTELGIFLLKYRMGERISQEQMAKKMGISRSYLSKIESGANNTPRNFKYRFLANYDATVEQLQELNDILKES